MSHKLFHEFFILILVIGFVTTERPTAVRAAGPWYVSPSGDDNDDCLAPTSPCATINGAIGKASNGDTVNVAEGAYNGTGSEVVLLDRDITLSGGWDAGFTTQSGISIIDGERVRRGIKVNIGVTVSLERFAVQNGFSGADFDGGGGIRNDGVLTVNNSIVSHSTVAGYNSVAGGIYNNFGTMILNNSSVSSNHVGTHSGGGIYNNFGNMILNNATISNNTAGTGAGIDNNGTLAINSSTISHNTALSIGGIAQNSGTMVLQNSIVAGNTGITPDCSFSPTSAGYNIIGEATSCNFYPTTGDQINVDPKLGLFMGTSGYHPLLSDSPAINAGNPAGCMGSEGILTTDQRGTARDSLCDIGAYEYTPPGAASSLFIVSGDGQQTAPTFAFPRSLQVAALDNVGSPISGINVTFAAPSSGASGTFSDTGTDTTSALTDSGGVATASTFTANDQFGAYIVSASSSGIGSLAFNLANAGWYVTPTGDDSNDCSSAGSPCATINGALAKASSGAAVYVAEGTYTGFGTEVALVNKDIQLLGGWDANFTSQNGRSTIDGQRERLGIQVGYFTTATIERFTVQNGSAGGVGGIWNNGNLTINSSTVKENTNGGILNIGILTVNSSSILHNTAGSGIANGSGGFAFVAAMTINNSTISGNSASSRGGGIGNTSGGTAIINNTTISGNQDAFFPGAGGVYSDSGNIVLQNSIVAGNSKSSGEDSDCAGTILSAGYNLIGSTSNCTFTPATGDLTDTEPNLGQLIGPSGAPSYHPLLSGSLAIDAGNPSGCTDQDGNFLNTDQRGAGRIGICDIGAYEFTTPGPAISLTVVGGDDQRTGTSSAFPDLLQTAALDAQGSPVSGVPVDFTAPGSGPSGTFADTNTNTTSAVTEEGGVAIASVFTANDQTGAYEVAASASGLGSVEFALEQIERPANDNFAGAEEILSLPFSTEPDVSDATLEPDEPQTCQPTDRSIWYSFVPPTTMILMADTLGSSNTKISIYRADGAGITNLQSVQCVSSGGAITFLVDPDQTYYFQVGAIEGGPGIVHFGLSEVTAITGRVTDAITGAPLPGDLPPFAFVTLQRVCGDGCLELISSSPASGDGRFRFDSYLGIQAGTYMIEVSASGYQTGQFGPFEFSGADLDVGDLAMDPVPAIGSISGRLVDAATGKPLSQAFPSSVELLRCSDGDCFESVSFRIPDSQGEFRFETDNVGNPLAVGTYQIRALADQYHNYQTELFEVGEGMHQSIGDLRITSFPVRFSDVQPCAELPASGGECAFSVRIWNGLNTKFKGSTWSGVNAQVPDSFISLTNFQVKAPQKLELDKGKSRIIRFRFSVPGSSSQFPAFICPNVFVGQGSNSLFNTVGFKDLFCIFRNTAGFSITSPHDAMEVVPAVRADMTAASTVTETEPNNSCQTAQDVGAIPPALVLDGNLNSTLEPDIDFYRFSGIAGTPIIIDYEGQATGKGTLDNPLLAFFDSNCNLITLTDDSNTENSRLEIPIPADGVFILGATAYPDFGLAGGGNGSYQLTVTPVPVIGSIRGRITGISGTPLRGDVEPFAVVYLLRCNEFGCGLVNSQATDSEGRFLFGSDSNGALLRTDNYQVVATANQYLEGQVEQFTVSEAEDYDMGDLALRPFPVVFSDIQPCSLPADGGVCNFSVKITNGLSTRLSGKAWSIVNGSDLGSFINFTTFQTDTVRDVKLDPGKSTMLRFRFRVRDSVADGATICSVVYVGKNPRAFFHPEGVSLLFCITKGAGGLTLMSAQDAQVASQQMQVQKLAPPELPTDRKK